ncbi:cytochrome c oxidase subunit 3 [Mycolicibacterium aubagnense]|uniref:Probable cytochrome c oxidase subunit 3 n=1 Tax=Mycolicibacterium aubagnense TaxID=319707 RepID=A0ABN5YSY5_9MYCO|nr:cytochrome c oxidase subunit 3 [Mycolicibacterium aubagnense]TLH59519.1 cytochrome C oxidase subunit III [Mycolicibacterium aubagnense]WGI34637.1 cytochrome c oxidase subunit 3 [Mycolicibacterium aubagnense]BBX83479.1 cytochrome c oxidase subunit III [Mycolicibacterium aubagnense]
MAHTSATSATKHLPANKDLWVFVLGDFVIFGSYFVIFMISRHHERDLFIESQRHLSLNIGVVNTLVLLASSWFVARAVQVARGGDFERARKLTIGGGLCGVVFMLVKAYEWSAKIAQGHTFPSNSFFMYYYMLTGVHLFHVAIGLVFLAVAYAELGNRQRVEPVETGATYWHMVDLLWVVIFALLYVMR